MRLDDQTNELETLRAERDLLLQERDGYKNAYEITAMRYGDLRMTAGPVVRDVSADELHGIPSIFLVTLPKSGTVFISHSLARTLGYDFTSTLITPTFPKNIVWETVAADFMRGRMVSASHMQPDAINIGLLRNAGISKVVVHVRDPRAALNSWFHFRAARQLSTAKTPERVVVVGATQAEQIDHYIESFYRPAIAWLAGWVDAERDMDILWTRHEKLRDHKTFFGDILKFYGISPVKLQIIEQEENQHFRTGNNADWQTTLTSQQIKRVNDMLPPHLLERFGWEV